MSNPFSPSVINVAGINSVSAGARRAKLPLLLNIQHRYDVTNRSSVWLDAGGTIPVTEAGAVKRIDDLGYAGDNLIDDAFQVTPMIWRKNQINGLPAVDTEADPALSALFGVLSVPSGAEGITIASVGYRSGATSSILFGLGDISAKLLVDDTSGLFSFPPNWGYGDLAAALFVDTGIPTVPFQWSYMIVTHSITGDYTVEVNGNTPITGNTPYVPTPAAEQIGFGGLSTGKQTEGIIWDIALGYNGRAQIRNYLNKKYGGLPHNA